MNDRNSSSSGTAAFRLSKNAAMQQETVNCDIYGLVWQYLVWQHLVWHEKRCLVRESTQWNPEYTVNLSSPDQFKGIYRHFT